MPPHTISPTPTASGLGISQSALSPTSEEAAALGFSGLGVRPRPVDLHRDESNSEEPRQRNPLPYPPQQQQWQPSQRHRSPPQPQYIPVPIDQHRQHYSQYQPLARSSDPNNEQTQMQPSPIRLTTLQQSGSTLRPAHTRKESKSFTSFSAILPSTLDDQQMQQLPSSMVRQVPHAPTGAEAILPKTSVQPLAITRADSNASVLTSASRGPRRSKSSDILRKFTRPSETVSGGQYVPLRGSDEDEGRNGSLDGQGQARQLPEERQGNNVGHVENELPLDIAFRQSQPVLHRHAAEGPVERPLSSSTIIAFPACDLDRRPLSLAAPLSPTSPNLGSDQADHSFLLQPNASLASRISVLPGFPAPPEEDRDISFRPLSRYSDHSQMSTTRRLQQAHGLPRSASQPLQLDDAMRASQYMSMPEEDAYNKRSSQVSSGVHSRNAVILSAESGGVMLAFSPSGDAVWRHGQIICGPQSGMVPTPDMIHQAQMAIGNSGEGGTRPWFQSSMEEPLLPKHNQRRHTRSNSDGAAVLARQGTLFYPTASSQRASEELGIMLGGRRRRLSTNTLFTPPDFGNREKFGPTEKVKLEAAKKRKARVEVDIVLERECVVEGGQVRGRMEVRVTGGKNSQGLRVGGGKIRVIGFEGERIHVCAGCS